MMPRQPELHVSPGIISDLPEILVEKHIFHPAILTGGRSIRGRDAWGALVDELLRRGVDFSEFTLRGEPSPEYVDQTIAQIRIDTPRCDGVVAIGGGSVIDAAKAVAAGLGMIAQGSHREDGFSILPYLEGVGDRVPDGATLPLLAMPTTAGTGSEATMNAVLSTVGEKGFKKSLRHRDFVPTVALIDPELQLDTPQEVTRASGLDCITQLLESFVSPRANTIISALARDGLERAGRAFPSLVAGKDNVELREEMATAAYLSGVSLAAAGLGIVHGLAAPIGARFDIPHGVVCGLLLAPSLVHAISHESVQPRYTAAAQALGFSTSIELIDTIRHWAEPLGTLGAYGVTEEALPELVGATGRKEHPVPITDEEIADLVRVVL